MQRSLKDDQDNKLYKVINKSKLELSKYQNLLDSFLEYSYQRLKYDQKILIFLIEDKEEGIENAQDALRPTGEYDHERHHACVYVTGRRFKDVCRSISHEIIHHYQMCRGDFKYEHGKHEKIYSGDKYLWKRELEAYELGNAIFRKWEDDFKSNKLAGGQQNQLKENRFSSTYSKLLGEIKEQARKESNARLS